MANSINSAFFVIPFTVLSRKRVQYPSSDHRVQLIQILADEFILGNTFDALEVLAGYDCIFDEGAEFI
jgi:hypothetical protein